MRRLRFIVVLIIATNAIAVSSAMASGATPVLSVSGTTLSWNAIPGASSYTLATILNPTTTRNTTYQTVTGTTFTPPAVPGQTVNYGLAPNITGGRWATEVTINWPASSAPVLKVSGTTLSWTAIPGASSYTLATILNPTTTRNTTYQTVTGTTFTPPAVPGQTVNYGLAPNIAGGRWATEVSINWPASAGALRVGLNETTGWGADPLSTASGIDVERLGLGDGSDISEVTVALSHGMKPLVTYDPGSNGRLAGVSPATAAAQVKALAQKLLPLGLTEIEFGNEVYWDEDAVTYAAQYNAAHAAIAGMGIKLLAVATALAPGCGGYSTTEWIPQFINALPGGAAEVDAWTIHPYGPMNAGDDSCVASPYGYGWDDVPNWHAIAVDAGSNAPWYITEVGQCLGGAGCHRPVSQQTQAADMTQYLNDVVSKYPWVVFLTFYTSRDNSAGQWGLLNDDNTPRPGFTALQTWMTTHATSVNG